MPGTSWVSIGSRARHGHEIPYRQAVNCRRGHKTSVSLEEAFWNGMKEISGLRSMTLSELVGEIDSNRQQGNLSSAIRLFVLDYFKNRAAAPQKSVSAPAGARF
jgi:predicted DNA-binding ribbon-helix-helix protein